MWYLLVKNCNLLIFGFYLVLDFLFQKNLDCGWTWTEFWKSGLDLDRKIWQSAHLWYRAAINIAETSMVKDWIMTESTLRQWCTQVIFVESELSQCHKPFQSESSHKTVESLRVIGLQAGVNVDSKKMQHFSYVFIATKWRPKKHNAGAHQPKMWCPMLF